MSGKHIFQIPFLKDHHNHLSLYSLLFKCPSLQGVLQKTDALNMIRALDKDSLSVVLGWNSGHYDFTPIELEEFPPVIIVNLSLHGFIMSKKAEEIMKPSHPEIVKNYRNTEWYERHFPNMLIFLANCVPARDGLLTDFFQAMEQKGIYYIEDMLLPNEPILNAIQHSSYAQRTAIWADPGTFHSLNENSRTFIKGIKLFTDGALGARTAAIRKPFKDGSTGYLLHSDDVLYRAMAEATSLKKGVSVHAIGEDATAQVVRVTQQLKQDGIQFSLLRMEHCQFIMESVAREAKELGIVLSMQPNFSIDSIDYSDRMEQWYLENNNPFRMLIDNAGFVPGEDLIFGSDGMPHGADAALNAALFPPYPIQKLSIDEFVAGYCMPDQSTGVINVEIKDNKAFTDLK